MYSPYAVSCFVLLQGSQIEDIKEVIRSRKAKKDRLCNGQQDKKRLKIPKGQSETVYRRRTDNTMAKRKKYKRTNNDQQNIHIKLKIE